MKKIFKKYMLAGMAVCIPLIGTILILKIIIFWADDLVISLIPLRFQPSQIFGYDIPGIGLIATVIIVLFVGVLTRLYIGKSLVKLGDRIISKIPLGNVIYSSIKQLISSVLSTGDNAFKSVVAIEYPHRGVWAIGFLTGQALGDFEKGSGKKHVYVFVPSTPMPTNGFLIVVPEDEVKYLSMSVDDAIKLIISGGMIQE